MNLATKEEIRALRAEIAGLRRAEAFQSGIDAGEQKEKDRQA